MYAMKNEPPIFLCGLSNQADQFTGTKVAIFYPVWQLAPFREQLHLNWLIDGWIHDGVLNTGRKLGNAFQNALKQAKFCSCSSNVTKNQAHKSTSDRESRRALKHTLSILAICYVTIYLNAI